MARESLLAELAFKRLPAVCLDAVTFLLRPLRIEPLSKAFKMNMAHSTGALTRRYQWILLLVFLSKANPADLLLLCQLRLLHQDKLLSMRLLLLERPLPSLLHRNSWIWIYVRVTLFSSIYLACRPSALCIRSNIDICGSLRRVEP